VRRGEIPRPNDRLAWGRSGWGRREQRGCTQQRPEVPRRCAKRGQAQLHSKWKRLLLGIHQGYVLLLLSWASALATWRSSGWRSVNGGCPIGRSAIPTPTRRRRLQDAAVMADHLRIFRQVAEPPIGVPPYAGCRICGDTSGSVPGFRRLVRLPSGVSTRRWSVIRQ